MIFVKCVIISTSGRKINECQTLHNFFGEGSKNVPHGSRKTWLLALVLFCHFCALYAVVDVNTKRLQLLYVFFVFECTGCGKKVAL